MPALQEDPSQHADFVVLLRPRLQDLAAEGLSIGAQHASKAAIANLMDKLKEGRSGCTLSLNNRNPKSSWGRVV